MSQGIDRDVERELLAVLGNWQRAGTIRRLRASTFSRARNAINARTSLGAELQIVV